MPVEVRRYGGPSRNEMFGKKRSFHPGDVLEIVVQTLGERIQVGQINDHSRAAKVFTVSFIAVCTGKSQISCLYLCIRHPQGSLSPPPQDPILLF
jgi:hypothetical protein